MTNGIKEALDKGVADNRLRYAGKSLVNGGEEGFWVPNYLIEQYPEMTTIEGVIKHAELFEHPEDDEKFAFYSCPAGWTCQITSEHLFNAMGLDKHGFEMVDPGSGAALAGTIAKAYEREKPWFGYYWAPTAVLGKYPMVQVTVGDGAYDIDVHTCNATVDCADPKYSSYPAAKVVTAASQVFVDREPAIAELMTNLSFTNAQMGEVLAWRLDNNASYDEAAVHFLTTNKDVWGAWLNDEAKGKLASLIK